MTSPYGSSSGWFLSDPEKRALNRLNGEEARRAVFLRFWTRKEAYIKADGRGVSPPLRRIDVSDPSGRVMVPDEAQSEWRACADWTLQTLAAGPGHAAALATEGRACRLSLWQW